MMVYFASSLIRYFLYNALSSIKQISSIYHISNNHLSKIVFELGKLKLIHTVRGRNGGIKLAKQPSEINIGWVIQQTEENLDLVECFNKKNNTCIISEVCKLKHVFNEALAAYLQVLSSYTLEDLLTNNDELKTIFQIEATKKNL